MAQRRRGEELKAAIYEATVELLENDGYEAVTFQNVARKAETTRSVIYRYWTDRFSLLHDAAVYFAMQNPKYHGSMVDAVINNGSLRVDLLQMLQHLRDDAALFPKNFLAYLFFEESQGHKIFDSAIAGVQGADLLIVERILIRAQERGEARMNISEQAKLLPFQLLRYHFFMNPKPMTDEEIVELVDDILMPVYQNK